MQLEERNKIQVIKKMFDIHQCACLSKAVYKTNPSDENTRNGIRELYIRKVV